MVIGIKLSFGFHIIMTHRKSLLGYRHWSTIFNLISCKQAISYFFKHKKLFLNQKKKMLNGKYYYPGFDFALFLEKQACKRLCYQYNNTSPENIRLRSNIMTKILAKSGKNFLIEQPFMCDYGYNIEIGENFCSSHNLLILDPAKVIFGDNVFVGPNCGFYTSIHPINSKQRKVGLEKAKPIVVGNNVWFGGNVVVLPGVTIGDNAVIGAGSIVSNDIPPNTLSVGTPCKVIKSII